MDVAPVILSRTKRDISILIVEPSATVTEFVLTFVKVD